MQYGLCCLSHVPMRRTVSDASEMLTELLFGDLVTVVDSYRQWVKVENRMDGYEGWVDSKQLMPLSKEEFDEHAANVSRRVLCCGSVWAAVCRSIGRIRVLFEWDSVYLFVMGR